MSQCAFVLVYVTACVCVSMSQRAFVLVYVPVYVSVCGFLCFFVRTLRVCACEDK